MKSIRSIALSIFLVTGIFVSAVYMSCAKKDTCQTVTCMNGGSCGGGICNCPIGWTGTFCQTSSFSGNWSGTDACDSNKNYNFAVEIDPSSTDTTKFIIKTPHGLPAQVIGTRSGATTVNISAQFCDTVKLAGTLTLKSNSSLTFSYTITDTNSKATIIQCRGQYSRQ